MVMLQAVCIRCSRLAWTYSGLFSKMSMARAEIISIPVVAITVHSGKSSSTIGNKICTANPIQLPHQFSYHGLFFVFLPTHCDIGPVCSLAGVCILLLCIQVLLQFFLLIIVAWTFAVRRLNTALETAKALEKICGMFWVEFHCICPFFLAADDWANIS